MAFGEALGRDADVGNMTIPLTDPFLKKFKYLLWPALGVSILTSCTQVFVFKVFNDTGTDLVVSCYDTQMVPKNYSIQAGASAEIRFPSQLTVKTPSSTWTYGMFYPDRSRLYVRHGWRIEDLQIETNGLIYVLNPNNVGMVQQLPPQPPGFPVPPTSGGQ